MKAYDIPIIFMSFRFSQNIVCSMKPRLKLPQALGMIFVVREVTIIYNIIFVSVETDLESTKMLIIIVTERLSKL